MEGGKWKMEDRERGKGGKEGKRKRGKEGR